MLYPEHHLSPEDLLHFVELDEFRDDWEHLGLNVDRDLWDLQILIMADPGGPPSSQGRAACESCGLPLEDGE